MGKLWGEETAVADDSREELACANGIALRSGAPELVKVRYVDVRQYTGKDVTVGDVIRDAQLLEQAGKRVHIGWLRDSYWAGTSQSIIGLVLSVGERVP